MSAMSSHHFPPALLGILALAALGLAAAVVASPTPSSAPAPPTAAAATKAPAAPAALRPFRLRVAGIESELPVLARFVAPGEIVEVTAVAGSAAGPFAARAEGVALESAGPGRWRFLAPASPGRAAIEVEDLSAHEVRRAPIFVLTPYRGEPWLDGFRIGSYPAEPLKNLAAYRRPAGFVAVRPADLGLAVSPHFVLGQFLCKQASPQPGAASYVALQTPLLIALERLLGATRAAGIPAETLYVMSGYRTPYYNEMIGNETTFSRHTYGDAADVYVDRDGDGRMDDLDHNGRIDAGDAQVLLDLAEGLTRSDVPEGGLGLYGPKPHRGPFLHIDTRGYAARWRM